MSAGGVVWIAFGTLVAMGGLIGLYSGASGLRLEYLVGKEWLPVRRVSGGATHILGRVRACGEVPLTAPATGREVVWYRTRVDRLGSGSKASRQTIWTETRSTRFYIEDDAADRAIIEPDGAIVLVDEHSVDSSRAAEFLRSHDEVRTGSGSLDVVEEVLAVGDRVHAIGRASRASDGAATTPGSNEDEGRSPYRELDRPAVVTMRHRKRRSLILSTSDEASPKRISGKQSNGATLAFGIVLCAMAPYIFAQAFSSTSPPPSASHR